MGSEKALNQVTVTLLPACLFTPDLATSCVWIKLDKSCLSYTISLWLAVQGFFPARKEECAHSDTYKKMKLQ